MTILKKIDNLQKLSYFYMTIWIWQFFENFGKYDNMQYDNILRKSVIYDNLPKFLFWKIFFVLHNLYAYAFTFWYIQFFSFCKKLNCHISMYDNMNMTIIFDFFWTMTICDMTIIFKFSKYDYFQYDNNFKKIVILKNLNMTKKKTYALRSNLWMTCQLF